MMDYAGFWRRFVAYLIDMIPLAIVVSLFLHFATGTGQSIEQFSPEARMEDKLAFIQTQSRNNNISFAVYLLYCILMEASPMGATLGKRIMGMRVVDEAGNRLGLGRAIARNCTKLLSMLALSLGFIWIAFSKKKQGWHDMIASTYVVKPS